MRHCAIALWMLTVCSLATAQPAPVAWKQSAKFEAPEAKQAAAADQRYLYAIDNTVVAKYDRATGKRVAVSTGPARHLNSGFFWEGKLYCAQSNFPQKPELSEIKVLDPATMQLSTFKDFGDYGGSLTWCVRRDENWWCNFARYGEANGETFLVQFDNEWKEVGRWTYSVDLIKRLGAYSLSGGVWRDDALLVTGHDDGWLYELRLPKNGRVIDLVEIMSVPFTGQGIADDPVTGGLVGIHRASRWILCVSPPKGDDSLKPK